VRLPKPEGLALPLPLSPDQPREASHWARLPGPDATRDEYCVYALSLTMRHIDLLPLSLLGARHGDTSVVIRVLSDGTISSVRVARGSGYSDIDDRIAQMVVAVGRFPPLPQWITGQSMDFTFHLHFPHPAQR
jgi:TonB family protein